MATCTQSPSWRMAVLAIAFGLCAIPAQLAAQTASARDLARRSLPSVVTILTFDPGGKAIGQGSGFIVDSTGLIVTNYHVIDDATHAKVLLQTGDEHPVDGVLEFDVQKDFALLKVRAIDLPTLRMGNSERLEPGEVVFALGAPRGYSGSVTTGNFSQHRAEGGYRLLQHSAAISPGSSGGPLLLESGEVIGINTSGLKEANSLYFALPINYVRAALANSDGRLVGLSDLTTAVREQRARLEKQRLVNAIQEHFTTYRDPENLFAAMVPRGWQIERNAWADSDGTYHVLLMAHAPAAQLAELNGWLSDGLRLHLTVPKKGLMWRADTAAQWIADGNRQMLASYARYQVTAQEQVTIDGIAVPRIELTGTSPKLREPEAALLYHVFHPRGKAVVEFAAPASKREELEAVRMVFEGSLKIAWQK